MKLWPAAAWALVVGSLFGCSQSTVVTPGTPRSVAVAAAAAYQAAGHDCQVKSDLVYCDTTGSGLPLLMGYSATRHELLFATVYDTEAAFGRTCPTVPADDVVHPEWMVLKCDEIEFDNKTRKVVLSMMGGGHIPDNGLSRAELNRSAGKFMHEAEGYLLRLKEQLQPGANDVQSTKL
jgi:hypothetical protein